MKKRPEIYLRYMMEADARIASYVGRMKRDAFLKDHKTQDAVIRQLEIMGEAAGKVPAATVKDSPIPWSAIVGMRHRLIHDYLGVDLEIVWKTVKDELPRLKSYLMMKING